MLVRFKSWLARHSKWLSKKKVLIAIPYLSLTIFLLFYFVYPLGLLLWQGGKGSIHLIEIVSSTLGYVNFSGDQRYITTLYYWVNIVSPIVLIVLTFLSVVGIVKTIRDGTEQRKLETYRSTYQPFG